jgi:protein SCO1
MKKSLIILLSGLVFAAIVLVLSFTRGSTDVTSAQNVSTVENKDEEHSCCSSEKSGEFTDNSIYQLESEWINQDNKEFRLSSFKGKPVVLTMFFASCTYACPILVNDMKKIESSLPGDMHGYNFVLVSIDPERDTPEALKNFADAKNLDKERWTLLTGSGDDIMELAALLGFKYKKEADGSYSHSNMILVLNEEGEITHQHNGLNQDITAVVTEINNL